MSNESELKLISVRCIDCGVLTQFETAKDTYVGDTWDQQDKCENPKCEETLNQVVKVVEGNKHE